MKQGLLVKLMVLLLISGLSLFLNVYAEAASFNDAASGSWNDGATWGNTSPGVAGIDYPGAGDTVTINSGTVTLTADAACGDITISTGGNLNAASYTITVSGNWNSSAVVVVYGTSTVKMTGASKTFVVGYSAPWNLIIGDGTNSASVSYSVTNWMNVANNDLEIKNNATLNVSASAYIYLPETGDLTINTGATFNVNAPCLTRYINDSSTHISTTGTFGGTGTFEYFVIAGSTNAPVTARAYGCNVAVAGSLNAVGVLGGGTSLNLGAKTLYLYDVDTNNDFYSILDNSGNIPVTATTLQVGGGPYYVTGKLISRGAIYTFTNVNVYSSQGFTSPTIDCLTGGQSSTWNISGNVTIDGVKTNKGLITAGSSTWNVGGNWNSSAGTFTYGTSTVTLGTSGQASTITTNSGLQFYSLTIIAGATVNAATDFNIASVGVLTISGTFDIASGKTVAKYGSTTKLIINNGGTLSGAGTFSHRVNGSITPSTINSGATISVATFNFQVFSAGLGDVSPGFAIAGATYQGNLLIDVSGNSNNGYSYCFIGGADLNVGGTLTIKPNLGWSPGDFKLILDNSQENRNITVGNLVTGNSSYNAEYSQFIAGSGTIAINGDVTIYPSDASGTNEISSGASSWSVTGNWTNNDTFTCGTSTLDFTKSSGTQTFISGGTGTGKKLYNLNHSGAGTLAISTNNVEVDTNGSIANTAGTITEASGYMIHSAVSLLLGDSSGSEVSEYIIRTDKVYARLVDEDENLNGGSADTTTVTVSGGTNGDSEQVTLTETGNATEIFMNSGGLTTASFDGSKTNNDGTLELSSGEIITVSYADSEDATDTKTDTAITRNPAANFLVSVSSPQVAGSLFDMTITARNADNSTATGYGGTVNLTLTYVTPSSGAKTLSTTNTASFTNGVATVSQRYDDAGIISITAADSSDSSMYGNSSNITFVPDSFSVSAGKTTLSVNEPFTLTVTAKNSQGATCVNYQDAATLSINYVTPSADQSGSLSKSTLSSGDWSGGIAALSAFAYNKFGIITVSVKDPTNTNKSGTSAQLTFLPKELSVQLASPSGGRDFYYKGEGISTTITAKDYNGSVVANYADSISFAGSNLVLPANYSFSSRDSGAHTFSGLSGSKKGKTSVTARDTTYSAISGKSSEFRVKEGAIRVIDTQGPVGTLLVNVKLIDSDGRDIINDNSTSFRVKFSERIPNKSAKSSALNDAVIFDSGTAQIEITDDQVEIVTVTPISEPYFDVVPGKVSFGGVGAPRLGAGARVLWWRELRQEEERK